MHIYTTWRYLPTYAGVFDLGGLCKLSQIPSNGINWLPRSLTQLPPVMQAKAGEADHLAYLSTEGVKEPMYTMHDVRHCHVQHKSQSHARAASTSLVSDVSRLVATTLATPDITSSLLLLTYSRKQ